MLWIKALHISFMVTWFAGLFYLPRVLVYHAQSNDLANDQSNDQSIRDANSKPEVENARRSQSETFKIMERKLLIMTHLGGVLTLVFGVVLLLKWFPFFVTTGWMAWKLALVGGLIVYHLYLIKLVGDFRTDTNRRSHVWYRIFNEIPVLFLFAIVILVVVKPA